MISDLNIKTKISEKTYKIRIYENENNCQRKHCHQTVEKVNAVRKTEKGTLKKEWTLLEKNIYTFIYTKFSTDFWPTY